MSGFETGPVKPADPLQAPGSKEGSKKTYFKIAKIVGIVFAVVVLAVMIFS